MWLILAYFLIVNRFLYILKKKSYIRDNIIPNNDPSPIPISKIIKLKCSTGIPNSDNGGEIYNQVIIKSKAILRNFIIAFGETKAFAIVKKLLTKSLN